MAKKATPKREEKKSSAPSFVKAKSQAAASEDSLKAIRLKVATARAMEGELIDLEEEIKKIRETLSSIYQKDLPDLMDQAGIDKISLPADGNYAAADAELKPYYSANIAAGWPAERRKEAFDWLESHGHGDLIKTAVEAQLPREKRAAAKKLLGMIEKAGFAANVKEAVHSATLTAWLKEQIELGAQLPPLELIGATVGKVVKLKERKS